MAGRQRTQQRIALVKRLVGKIDPRDEALQESTGKDGQVDVRRLRHTIAARHRARLDRAQAEATVGAGGGAAEPVEVGIDRSFLMTPSPATFLLMIFLLMIF